MALDFNQYTTAKAYLGSFAPSWVLNDLEKDRCSSYAFYEQVYWTVDQTFAVLQRGKDTKPIYIPSGRTIVETLNRYVAKGMTITVDPELGTPQGRELAEQVWRDFASRERFFSKFKSAKRYGLIRGDWVWHITADPNREPGSRVSINAIDPASWFPIYSDEDPDLIIGVHIIDQYETDAGETRLKRLTYRKVTGTGGPSPITSETAIYKLDDWGGPGMDQDPTPEQVLIPLQTLPAPIDDLPVYAIRNNEGDSPYGSSEMRGLERIMAAVNQSISDEDLTLAMDGLGVYATDAGKPIDEETGEEVGWDIGPAKVIEVPEGGKFERVTGTSTVAPYQEHLGYLHDKMNEASSSPAVARGAVDVNVAESGVALTLQMGPILDVAEDRDQTIRDVLGNILFNLPKWYVAYEGGIFNSLLECRYVVNFGDKLPTNKAKTFEEVMAMFAAKIISGSTARNMLRNLGYSIPEETEEFQALLTEKDLMQRMEADAFGIRAEAEISADDPAFEDV